MAFYRCGGPTRTLKHADGFYLMEPSNRIRTEPFQSVMDSAYSFDNVHGHNLIDVFAYTGGSFLGGSIIVPRVLGQTNKYIDSITLNWGTTKREISNILQSTYSNSIDVGMSFRQIYWPGGDPMPLCTYDGGQGRKLSEVLNQGYISFYYSGVSYPSGGILTIAPYVKNPKAGVLSGLLAVDVLEAFESILDKINITFSTSNIS